MHNFYYVTYECILPIGICIVLPIIVVGLISYTRIRRDNARRDIVLHVLEKNAEIDVEELVRKSFIQQNLRPIVLCGLMLFISYGIISIANNIIDISKTMKTFRPSLQA